MLDVKAKIISRSVYIPEETIICELTLSYKNDKDDQRNKINTRTKDCSSTKVAYASAQIYCQCNLNERRLCFPTNTSRNQAKQDSYSQKTSFSPVLGERGNCLYASEATILFCDLNLKIGESKKFIYKETLPFDIPPSFKGQNIKLSYKVCIGIGRIGKPAHTIQLPFRVFELKGIFKSLKQKALEQKEKMQHESVSATSQKPVNPFLQEREATKFSKLDVAMDALTAFTVKRNLNTYNIHSENGAVGRFCLSKHYYRIGEDILGTFDFNNASIACVQYAVSVQIEETISKSCLLQPSNKNLVHYSTVNRHEECCYLATKTNFLLPIPVTSTPEFTHKIVSVRWRLHFEFTIVSRTGYEPNQQITTDTNEEQTADKKGHIQIPSNLRTELMLWDLPLHVVATNPIQASLMVQNESCESITLES